MSTVHGTFSIGALVGAGIGALCALASISPKMQWTGIGILSFAAGIYALTLLPKSVVAHHGKALGAEPGAVATGDPLDDGGLVAEDGRPGRPGSGIRLSWPLVALAVICFASLLSEGAASDWSAVYMHTSLGATPAVATLAYAGFTATMVVGRLTGDRLSTRYGPVLVVRTAAVLGAAGLGTGLAVADPVLAIVGFTLLGFGLSASFPLAITTASGLGQAGPAVAMLTSCGYLGMLSGPAVIGGLASVVGLPTALSLLVALCALLAVLAGTLGHRFGPPSRGAPVPAAAGSLEALDR
jgi:hypothetical protein